MKKKRSDEYKHITNSKKHTQEREERKQQKKQCEINQNGLQEYTEKLDRKGE